MYATSLEEIASERETGQVGRGKESEINNIYNM